MEDYIKLHIKFGLKFLLGRNWLKKTNKEKPILDTSLHMYNYIKAHFNINNFVSFYMYLLHTFCFHPVHPHCLKVHTTRDIFSH